MIREMSAVTDRNFPLQRYFQIVIFYILIIHSDNYQKQLDLGEIS